jgi:2-oxoglutarate dehydrogenase complex dihydrolipoamide succinyltransferase (E2) component
MPVEILMPELGESVHEGTVSRWLKKVGDTVKEDEPIVEIMTDKVNTELPSPASGVLSKILIQEGDLVQVFAAMGIIDDGGTGAPATAPEAKVAPEVKELNLDADTSAAKTLTETDGRKWYTPVVRAMAKERGISEADLAGIAGTGEGGRVTKKDIEAFLVGGGKPAVPAAAPAPKLPEPKPAAPTVAGPDQTLTPLAGMRKMIAEHMVRSSQVPVVTTITECDVTNMVNFRTLNKDSFQATYGVKLTYTPFFIKALAESLAEYPLVNSSLTADNQILTTKGVHVGIAVALGKKGDEGLIVPVIRDCDTKSLIQIAKDLEEIAGKARSNKLGVEDVKGGTFTLTNPGTYGASFGTPMINAPQAGILGVYTISKRPVVINDAIAIRSMMNLVLTYDHRLIDGMLAGKFLAAVRDRLQAFDFFK